MEIQLNIPEDDGCVLISKTKQLPERMGIYKMYNDQNNLLYIGKTQNLQKRIRQHKSYKSEFILKCHKICYFFVSNSVDLELFETYLINNLKPPYNQDKTYYKIDEQRIRERENKLELEMIRKQEEIKKNEEIKKQLEEEKRLRAILDEQIEQNRQEYIKKQQEWLNNIKEPEIIKHRQKIQVNKNDIDIINDNNKHYDIKVLDDKIVINADDYLFQIRQTEKGNYDLYLSKGKVNYVHYLKTFKDIQTLMNSIIQRVDFAKQ